MLDAIRQDARYAARALARSPLFTLIAVLSIAIGVGATTAIVTLANSLLFRPLPGIGDPDRLVLIGRTQDGQGFDNFSWPNFADYRAQSKAVAGMAALRMEPHALSLRGPEGGEPIHGTSVSGNFFSVLQARPARGRFFAAEEDGAPGTGAVVVLSHRFWQKRFAGADSIVGRTVVLNGQPMTVVGVAEEGFQGPFVLAPDLWLPMSAATMLGIPASLFQSREAVWLVAVGRLASGATLARAQTELDAIAARLRQAYPQENEGKGVRVTPTSAFPGEMRTLVAGFMAVLFAVAAMVLVIASTNVAGMLLARAVVRQREIAVRLALGATRGRLVRQLVTESLLVFLLAGAIGVALAYAMVQGLLALVPRLPLPVAIETGIDWRVLAFALGASLVTGVLAGLVPAWQSTSDSLVPALKADAGHTGRRLRLRNALLVAQIAFSMLLLIVAGLFGRTLLRARAIDPGFDPRGVHVASLDMRLAGYDSLSGRQFTEALYERAVALPGVRAAAFTAMLPLDGGGLGLGPLQVDGRTPPDERRGWNVDWNVVSPGYFEVMRMPLARGRDFTAADRAGSPDVAIVNELFAEALWPGQDPIGRTIRNGERTLTVIGVARNAKYRTLGEPPRNFIFVALAQRWFERTSLVLRHDAPDGALNTPLRRLVASIDPALPILDQRSLEDQTATSLFPQRVALWVSANLGVVALLLALLGIYGVTAFAVAQRTREIGVRIALGAQRGAVLAMVLRQGVVLAAIGIAIGSAAGVGVTRLLQSLLYGVSPADAVAFAGAAALLGVAAVAASWLPARRAAGVDPVVALRSE